MQAEMMSIMLEKVKYKVLSSCRIFPVIACLMPLLASAQASNGNLTQCATITDDKARLACYDNLTERTNINSNDSEPATARVMQGNQRLGADIARLRNDRQSARVLPAPAAEIGKQLSTIEDRAAVDQEFTDRIKSLANGPSGWIITLDKGQVWRQMISKRYDLRAGQSVRIYPTAWGHDYRLSDVENSGFIQVERIR